MILTQEGYCDESCFYSGLYIPVIIFRMDEIFIIVLILFLLYILSNVIFRRSLAEKVQLFQNLKQEEKPAAKPNVPPPVARRRKGKIASRFSTQVNK